MLLVFLFLFLSFFDVIGVLLDAAGFFLGIDIGDAGVFVNAVGIYLEVFGVHVYVDEVSGDIGDCLVDVVGFSVGVLVDDFCFGAAVAAV